MRIFLWRLLALEVLFLDLLDFDFDDVVLFEFFVRLAEDSEVIKESAAKEAKKSRRFKKIFPARGLSVTETKRPCRRHGLMN